MPLGAEFDGLLIDLDGVVWVGESLLPGAAETLNELRAAGCELIFVTNNPAKPPAFYAKRLQEAGVHTEEERVVTAGIVTARLAGERIGKGGTAFVIGASAFKEEVAAAGLQVLAAGSEQVADAVLVSGHRGFDYEELLSATRMLQQGAKLFATSRDPTLPMPGGAWPGTGAVLAAVETASGAVAEIGGKPERHLFEQARERMPGAGRVAMVGDRVASDIVGGRRAGLETVLVLSGATSREEAERADPAPDHVLEDLAALLR